jgi:CBS domain-containing protein
MDGETAPSRYETELMDHEGRPIRVVITLSRIVVQGRVGFMAVVTRLAQPRELDLMTTDSAEDLAAANRRMATMASLMVSHGAESGQIVRMLSTNADAAIRRGVELAVEELGEPPVPFDILLMGSLGRAEVSLLADQDHAVIYPDPPAGGPDPQEYFLRLGSRLADILAAAGYPYCPGGIMSGEPDCCQSLSGWKQRFSAWIHTLEAEDLLQAKIFFDFRGRQGEENLAGALWEHLHREIARQPRFLHLLARSILQYEPPLNTFGSFVLEQDEGGAATFDVKGVMAQVVDFVRLRALQHGVGTTGTLGRLEALALGGHLNEATYRDLVDAFGFLMELRLQHQAGCILDRLDPDNRIDPATLTTEERKRLKSVFANIKAIQAALDHEFKGA